MSPLPRRNSAANSPFLSRLFPTSGEDEDVRQEWFERGRHFLAINASIDIHAHPGRFFMRPDENTELSQLLGPVAPQKAIQDMVAGQVGGVVFALVADHCLLALSDRGLRARREFAAGEAFAEYVRQMQALDEVLAEAAASGPNKIRVYRAVEGGDFIEAKLDRIGAAASRGIQFDARSCIITRTRSGTHRRTMPFMAVSLHWARRSSVRWRNIRCSSTWHMRVMRPAEP